MREQLHQQGFLVGAMRYLGGGSPQAVLGWEEAPASILRRCRHGYCRHPNPRAQ